MKKILLIQIIVFGLLFNGCGSSNSKKENPKDDNTSTTLNEYVDYSIPLKYNYNKDGSSRQRLAPLYVNKHDEIQKKLNEKKSDSVEFYSILSGYIGDLYIGTDSLSKLPSYAPRGKSKSQVITVSNGQVDYSSYKLKGDIDFNWKVDFEDLKLLSEAILNDIDTFQYDINGDGKVDTSDVIDLVARLENEIKSFDFYTTSGTKLNLVARTVDEEKHFTYTGSETKVMVVAKDRNGASAFESGLSDIGDVWYKKDGWVLQSKIPKLANQNILPMFNKLSSKNTVNGWKFYRHNRMSVGEYVKSHPYLIGWKFKFTSALVYLNNGSLSGFSKDHSTMVKLDEEPLKSYLKLIETEIMKYFSTTDMNHSPQYLFANQRSSLFQVGALVDKSYNDLQKISLNVTYRNEITGEVKNMNYAYMSDMTIYYSPKSHMFVGGLQKDDGSEVKGVVMGKRVGPYQEDDVSGDIEDSIFEIEPASFGTYDLTYYDECTCSESLGEYVFEEEVAPPPIFKVSNKKVKVNLKLEDKDGNPLGSKTVKIVAKACVSSDESKKSFFAVTDSSGNVNWSNVPIGDYMVYVDGKEESSIHFCESYAGDITLEGKHIAILSNINDTLINNIRETYTSNGFRFEYTEHKGCVERGYTMIIGVTHGIVTIYKKPNAREVCTQSDYSTIEDASGPHYILIYKP